MIRKSASRTHYIPLRYILAFLITVLEVAAVIGIVIALCCYVPYFYLLAWATEIVCIIRIIASDDNPDYKAPWLLFVMILPIAGFMLYFMFYSRRLQPRFVRRLDRLKESVCATDDSADLPPMLAENPSAAGQARMLTSTSIPARPCATSPWATPCILPCWRTCAGQRSSSSWSTSSSKRARSGIPSSPF